MKKVVVLTGSGISAESGIKTFREAGGLWEGHDVMEVASPIGWKKNPSLVLNFYNERRKQLLTVKPNKAHFAITELEEYFDVTIITQNVDNLHEKAKSKKILHLHGELLKVRSSYDENLIYDWEKDLVLGDVCELKSQLRPYIVWFGEAVPMLDKAIQITSNADILIIIGTSLQVYPAASLINFVKSTTQIYLIDPKPTIAENSYPNLKIIAKKASIGMVELVTLLTQ